jgi:AbrB family looped-hinge helix DNA binding protein
MITKVSSKGQLVLPKALREMAHIREGDELEVGLSGSMIVLREPEPLNQAKVRRLLKEGRKLPEQTPEQRRIRLMRWCWSAPSPPKRMSWSAVTKNIF